MPPKITVPGIVGSIPAGYILGRVGSGSGPIQLLRISDLFQSNGPAGTGTVSGISLTAPNIFTVSGSPVKTTGTLSLQLVNQAANRIFAGPGSGASTAPTFRALVTADLPAVGPYLDTLGSAQGDLLYRGASGWAALSPGTSGRVLVTAGVGADPAWGQVDLTADVTGILPIGNGGTGGNTAAAARAALGLGALAVENAITVAQLPTPPTFSVYLAAAQSVASGAFAKVLFDTAEWNVGSCFDLATNHRLTPNQAGKYLLTAAVSLGNANDIIVSIYKNGVEYKRGAQLAQSVSSAHSIEVTCLVAANGTTDYFEVFVFQDSGGAEGLGTGATLTWFQGAFISP